MGTLFSGIDCFDDILDLFLESFKNVDGKYSMKLKAYGCAKSQHSSGEYDDLLLKSVLDLANANMDQMKELGISFKLDYKANVVIADAASSESIIKGGSTIKFKSGDSEVQGKILEVAQAADANGNVEITVEVLMAPSRYSRMILRMLVQSRMRPTPESGQQLWKRASAVHSPQRRLSLSMAFYALRKLIFFIIYKNN